MPQVANVSDRRVTRTNIALPPPAVSLGQDREWCVVEVGGRWKKIREMLQRCIREARVEPGDLRVLDLGAGNGMVGEELARFGVRRMVGVDIISAAAEAARRDRQDVYDDYFVLDMTDVPDRDLLRFESLELNCLTCVAALGFGDILPAAFANAYNLIGHGGWVAFNIKSDFLESDDPCGFAGLIRRMIDDGVISIRTGQQYEHRLATSGEPLVYTAFVGVKNRDVPATWEL